MLSSRSAPVSADAERIHASQDSGAVPLLIRPREEHRAVAGAHVEEALLPTRRAEELRVDATAVSVELGEDGGAEVEVGGIGAGEEVVAEGGVVLREDALGGGHRHVGVAGGVEVDVDEDRAVALMEVVEPAADDAGDDRVGLRLDAGGPRLLERAADEPEAVRVDGVAGPARAEDDVLPGGGEARAVERRHEQRARVGAGRREGRHLGVDARPVGAVAREEDPQRKRVRGHDALGERRHVARGMRHRVDERPILRGVEALHGVEVCVEEDDAAHRRRDQELRLQRLEEREPPVAGARHLHRRRARELCTGVYRAAIGTARRRRIGQGEARAASAREEGQHGEASVEEGHGDR